jgi:hypothetical protein
MSNSEGKPFSLNIGNNTERLLNENSYKYKTDKYKIPSDLSLVWFKTDF